ncbi:hypothetical protein Tsubulata_021178 [Turnera subulata]|uniref:Uncharacterized protein n=1 Tax=Turnera subulata TaxID=218843 RepID=A0A9Q0FJM7_9ROSI|nr:hypothetical protein Tsubulata_021178 [Turnera subulata]
MWTNLIHTLEATGGFSTGGEQPPIYICVYCNVYVYIHMQKYDLLGYRPRVVYTSEVINHLQMRNEFG